MHGATGQGMALRGSIVRRSGGVLLSTLSGGVPRCGHMLVADDSEWLLAEETVHCPEKIAVAENNAATLRRPAAWRQTTARPRPAAGAGRLPAEHGGRAVRLQAGRCTLACRPLAHLGLGTGACATRANQPRGRLLARGCAALPLQPPVRVIIPARPGRSASQRWSTRTRCSVLCRTGRPAGRGWRLRIDPAGRDVRRGGAVEPCRPGAAAIKFNYL